MGKPPLRRRDFAFYGLLVAQILVFATTAIAAARQRILVQYRAEGPHAVEACAEGVFANHQAMSASTADRSDSLDRWSARHRAEAVRAVFRRSDGIGLERQRRRLIDRIVQRRASRGAKTMSVERLAETERLAARLANVYAVDLPSDSDFATALAELKADDHVAFAQPDHVYALDYAPNDPFLTSSGSWGQTHADLWGLDRIHARQAWQTTRGAGQVVAVVDTGLDYDHPDIADNVWVHPGEDLNENGRIDASDWNGIDDDGNGYVDDLRGYDFAGFGDRLPDGSTYSGDPDPYDVLGHGTHVSGTIAAVANNGIGIAGVAPEATVMPIRGFDDQGGGRDSDLWRGVLYAIENGADVINASWSCSPACPDNPLAREVLAVAHEANVAFVTSAGNDSLDVVRNEPERTTAAITVGSIGVDDQLSYFSNSGWLMDLVAPGGGPGTGAGPVPARNILSLAAKALPVLQEFFRVGDDYYRLAGTSMAAPHVSGAVALLRAAEPGITVAEIRRRLRRTARDLPPEGHDPIHGAGALDLSALLATPPVDLVLELIEPGPGTLHDPKSGPLSIVVRAAGQDAESFSLARAEGRIGSEFEQLASWTPDGVETRSIVWRTAGIEAGPQTLRLRATLRSGEHVDEYTVIGIERVSPMRISMDSRNAFRPDISEIRVVWEAVDPDDPLLPRAFMGFFPASWRRSPQPLPVDTGEERPQRGPRIDRGRIVFREPTEAGDAETLVGCDLVRTGPQVTCSARRLAMAAPRAEPVAFARSIVLWGDVARGLDIVGCRWRLRGQCLPTALRSTEQTRNDRLLAFDGRTAVWKPSGVGSIPEFCRVDSGDLTCVPIPVVSSSRLIASTSSAGIDGDLLAIEIFNVAGSRIAYCRLDRESGDCPLRFVSGTTFPSAPSVSGERIVWTEGAFGEDRQIVYCELDPIDESCLRQRLTGSPFSADSPAIDGNRLVWSDDRYGPAQIVGIELPALVLAPRARIHPGETLRIPIGLIGSPERLGGWYFSLEAAQGVAPAALNARVLPSPTSPGGRATLWMQAPRDIAAGRGIWRLVARSPADLETRFAFEIEIADPYPRAGREDSSPRNRIDPAP